MKVPLVLWRSILYNIEISLDAVNLLNYSLRIYSLQYNKAVLKGILSNISLFHWAVLDLCIVLWYGNIFLIVVFLFFYLVFSADEF